MTTHSRSRTGLVVVIGVAVVVVLAGLASAGLVKDSRTTVDKPATSAATKCQATTRRATSSARGLSLPPFASSSPFNVPIPADARVAPDSARQVGGLLDAATRGGFLVAVRRYTVPVYYATPETPRFDVEILASWRPRPSSRGIPIPAHAQPDPGEDGHMAVIDRARNCVYDFFKAARRADGGWSAKWMAKIALSSEGVHPKLSARGSGFALLSGLIFPNELRAGEIRHALVFSYPEPRAGGPVFPASESDGTSTKSYAMPEGTRLRLDPALDLSTLGLTPSERTIARALQVYGMYLADDGGDAGVTLYAAHPSGYRNNPYEGLLPDDTYAHLNIPLDRFQVLVLERAR